MYIFFIQPLREKIQCPLCYPASIDMISNWQPDPAFPNPFHIGSFASSAVFAAVSQSATFLGRGRSLSEAADVIPSVSGLLSLLRPTTWKK